MLRLSRLWLWLLAWLSVQAVQAVRLQDTGVDRKQGPPGRLDGHDSSS
jgi:hypothetical protein